MKKLYIPVLLLILVISSLLAFSRLTFGHIWGDDFASYIMQASSILDGTMDEFILRNTFTIENSSYPVGPVAYPWGYPLLLAPVYYLRGLMPFALKMVNIPAYTVFLVAFFFFLKRRISVWESLLLVSVFAFNPKLIEYQDQVISDIAFIAVSILGLAIADKYVFEKSSGRGLAILTGVLIFLAYFLRTVGILLLVALFVFRGYQLYQQKRLSRSTIITESWPFAAFIVLWILTSLIFPSGEGSYFSHYGLYDFWDALRHNFVIYFSLGADFFMGVPANSVVYGLALAFFVIGFSDSSGADTFTKLYFTLSMLLLLTWPEPQGVRFIFPLLPIFIYFSFKGMKTSYFGLTASYPQMGRTLTYTFWISTVVFFLAASSNQGFENLATGRDTKGPFDRYARETYNFIEENIPDDSVFVFFKPRAMRMITGHDSILIDSCEGFDTGDHIIINLDRGEFASQGQLMPGQVRKCGILVNEIFENRKFLIFEIVK